MKNKAESFPSSDELFSVAAVAEATGIAPDTLRVWERRYGKPRPLRLESGHRRYTSEQIRWLRLVAEALARGHRPRNVVPRGDRELIALLGESGAGDEGRHAVDGLLKLACAFDDRRLSTLLRQNWQRMEASDFVSERVEPFLEAIGRGWVDGKIGVRHEHSASELLEHLLRDFRRDLRARPDAPLLLLTTLPGESHGLGLQLAALSAARGGLRVQVLGTDTPVDEIVAAVQETGAAAVGISVSLANASLKTDRVLSDLRKMLPSRVSLVVGGRGARGVRRGVSGVAYVEEARETEDWTRSLMEKHLGEKRGKK